MEFVKVTVLQKTLYKSKDMFLLTEKNKPFGQKLLRQMEIKIRKDFD